MLSVWVSVQEVTLYKTCSQFFGIVHVCEQTAESIFNLCQHAILSEIYKIKLSPLSPSQFSCNNSTLLFVTLWKAEGDVLNWQVSSRV